MVLDQVIDVFKDTVFKVGKANKRLYEKVAHKQRINYKMIRNVYY